MMGVDSDYLRTLNNIQSNDGVGNIPGGELVGGTSAVDVTDGQAAMTAGEPEAVTGQAEGVQNARGLVVHCTGDDVEASVETTARAAASNCEVAGVPCAERLEVAGVSTTAQEGNDKAHEGAVDVTAGSVPDEVEGVCRTDGTLRRRVGNEKVQQTQVTTTLVGDCVNNICISNKPIHYREGMALEPSPVQGDISVVAAGTCGLCTDNMGLQVEVDDGELVDTAQQEHDRLEHELFHETTSDEEESDFPFVHWQDTYWQELGASVIRWAWQRDTIALTVALVTGNNTAFGRGLLAETDVWCGWVGSNMDRAPSREGHVRLMELNPRVMAQQMDNRWTFGNVL